MIRRQQMTKTEKLLFLAIRYGHEETIDRLDFILFVILVFGWKLNICEWYWPAIMAVINIFQFFYGLFFGYEMKKLMKEMFGTLDENQIPTTDTEENKDR